MFTVIQFSKNKRRGFTLLELLLYISASGMLLMSTSLFLSTLLQSRIKNQTVAEVEQQGLQVMHIITQSIRNADALTSPQLGQNSSSINLTESGEEIIFNISNGVVQLKEGTGNAIPLTNSRVIASDINFSNVGLVDTNGSIKVSFKLTHRNETGRNEYAFSKDFFGSASLR